MKTAHPSRFDGLQQLRFFAALAVLLHHVLEESTASPFVHLPLPVIRVGACGVDVFFVVSGLVMWHATRGFSAQARAGDFFARRLKRILPPYWACLLVILLLWSTGALYQAAAINPASVLEAAFLLPATAGVIMGVSWTLVYEIYFYAICAIVLWLPWWRSRVLLIPALLLVLPLVPGWLGAPAYAHYYGNPIVVEFVFGLMLGRLLPVLPALKARWIVVALCVPLFYLVSVYSPGMSTYDLPRSVRWWAWGIPAAATVMAFASIPPVRSAAGAALNALGESSYLLYLTHEFFIYAFTRIIRTGIVHNAFDVWVLVGITIAAAVGFAHGLHALARRPALAERPVLAWLHGRERRATGAELH